MFGHGDDEQQQNNGVMSDNTGSQPMDNGASQSAPPVGNESNDMGGSDYIMTDTPAQQPMSNDDATPAMPGTVEPTATGDANMSNDTLSSGSLLDIKQQALQQLTPLVGHLDQSPEEKFRTTMMMIQASDNANLVPEAYTAAQQITDEKARAQALLDIVNEINYFTQNQHES